MNEFDRRRFIRHFGMAAMSVGYLGHLPMLQDPDLVKLTILHTNDVHSRIDPFPMDGSKNAGLGGVARRAAIIERIRRENQHVLLLDAGDIFQGTPYFNYFGGALELQLMSKMKYDAATIGNHDFDGGIESLAKHSTHAHFPFVVSNYELSDTPMHDQTKPFEIIQRGPLKIGVIGVGIELDGLVPKNLTGNTQYQDPISQANVYAAMLKEDENCDYVICLSHLGYQYQNQKVSDHTLAKQSRHIDLIIGGHTHTFLNEPKKIQNLDNQTVLINQAGWAGIILGRIDLVFERNRKNRCVACNHSSVKVT